MENKELTKAAYNKNYKKVEELIKNKVDINFKDETGSTALIYVSELGNFQIAKLLIENNANVNEKDNNGNTALMKVAPRIGENDLMLAEKLLEGGANINEKNQFGLTALMIASGSGNVELVKKLLEKRVELNFKGVEGNTALMMAIRNNNFDIAKMIIENKADLNLQNDRGETALMIAVKRGNKEIIKMLIENGANLDLQNEDKETALMIATEYGEKEIAKLLMEKGADVNLQNVSGETAEILEEKYRIMNEEKYMKSLEIIGKSEKDLIVNAIENGNEEMLKALIEKGANVNFQDEDGNTALMLAIEREDEKTAKLLIENGADVNLQNKNGITALMLAMNDDKVEVVEKLIENKVYINFQDNSGRTALMMAVSYGNMKMIEKLIENGADLNLQDNDGRTVLDYTEDKEIIKKLLKNGINKNIQKLSETEKRINQIKNIMIRQLYRKAMNGDLERVKILLSKKIDINEKNAEGITPLMIASKYGHSEIVEELLNKGALVSICDKDGKTALTYARESENYKINEQILNKLEERFKEKMPNNINEVDENGTTQLVKSLENKNHDFALYLIEKGADLNNTLKYILKNENLGLLRIALEREDNILNLKDNQNIKVINEFLKSNSDIKGKALKILLEKGLDINKLEKNFEIGIFKKGQDRQEIRKIIDEVLKQDNNALELLTGKIKRVDIIPKKEGYRIVLRKVKEKGDRTYEKAYKRYTCIKESDGYKLIKLQKKKDRWEILKFIRKFKKLFRRIYRRMKVSVKKYEELEKDTTKMKNTSREYIIKTKEMTKNK